MKLSIIAGIVLLLVIALVAVNAIYVRSTTNDLLQILQTLPPSPNPQETPEAVAELRAEFERHIPWLGLSVGYTVLDRVEESLVFLEAHARAEDVWQYAATLAVLDDLIRDLKRLEMWSLENLL